jgi:DNA-directed RNA polymerase subunit RPC12/RpoP
MSSKKETIEVKPQTEQPQSIEAVAVEPSALAIIERAEIDMQISTARKYPRSISDFNKKAIAMVSSDEETAERCLYCRPVGKNQDGTQIYARGESIRLAEIVAGCYGNIRVAGIVTEMTPRYVKAVGMAHDLESNYAAKAEVVEATVKRNGQPYDERMRVVAAKAAQSKAIRDAIFRIVPKSLCKSIINVAQEIALGKGEPLETRRGRVLEWINKLGIDPKRVYTAIGVKSPKEMDTDKLAELTGIKTAIKDGEITIDEAFPNTEELKNDKSNLGAKGLKGRLKKVESKEVKESAPTEKGEKLKQKAKKEIEKLQQAEQQKPPTEKLYKCTNEKTCGKTLTEEQLDITNEGAVCPECGMPAEEIK